MEWQPIETAPKDGRYCDVYDAWRGKRMVSRWVGVPPGYQTFVGREEGWAGWDYNWNNGPTHWQPLPAPPTPTEAQ